MRILIATVRITLLQQGSKLEPQVTAKWMKMENVWWIKNINDFYQLGVNSFIKVSAKNGLGIKNLKEELFNQFHVEKSSNLEKEINSKNIKLSILGKPNAGKSTLFNSIVKENRSIVSAKAGTTRDAISKSIFFKNDKIELFDTAGLRKKSKVNHLSYVGDSDLGNKVNIGAGTITCNYDGYKKNKTKVRDDVFIGSNSSLVAPVTINEGSVIGAGSVITKNVKKKSLALTRALQIEIKNYKRKK